MCTAGLDSDSTALLSSTHQPDPRAENQTHQGSPCRLFWVNVSTNRNLPAAHLRAVSNELQCRPGQGSLESPGPRPTLPIHMQNPDTGR